MDTNSFSGSLLKKSSLNQGSNRMLYNRVENEIKDHAEDLEAMKHELMQRNDYLNAMYCDLQEAQEKANAANRAKSDLLAKVNHEIRPLMNAIIGMVELAMRENELGAVKEYVSSIKLAGSNLLAIINDLDLSKPKVLIVDDISTNLIVANRLLFPYNMSVRLCKSGFEAIDEIKSKDYDLVFMDHQMPGMDGVETTRRIRDMGNADNYYLKLPIVALTANDVFGAREMFLESGFDDFLAKPIDTTKLDTILKKWIPIQETLDRL